MCQCHIHSLIHPSPQQMPKRVVHIQLPFSLNNPLHLLSQQSRPFWLTWGLFSAVVDCYWSGTSVKRIVWLPPSVCVCVCVRTQRGSIWTSIRSVDLPEKHNTMTIYTAVSTRNNMHFVNVKWSLDLNYAEWNATETEPWLVLPKSWMHSTR